MTTERASLDSEMRDRLDELSPTAVADTKHDGVQVLSSDIGALHVNSHVTGVVRTVTLDPSSLWAPVQTLDAAKAGEVIVADTDGSVDEAIWGELLSTYAKTVGVKGVITNGAVRDVDGIRALEFPTFARATIPRGPSGRTELQQNEPVEVGDATVKPGDVVVGNETGVVVIERDVVADVLDEAEAIAEAERNIERTIEEGETLAGAFKRAELV